MENQPIVIERIFKVPASKVWNAITRKDEMKKWYFDLPEFRPEPGFQFQFSGGPSPERQYLHLCEIIEAIPENKLSHSWQYDGYLIAATIADAPVYRFQMSIEFSQVKGLGQIMICPDFESFNAVFERIQRRYNNDTQRDRLFFYDPDQIKSVSIGQIDVDYNAIILIHSNLPDCIEIIINRFAKMPLFRKVFHHRI